MNVEANAPKDTSAAILLTLIAVVIVACAVSGLRHEMDATKARVTKLEKPNADAP